MAVRELSGNTSYKKPVSCQPILLLPLIINRHPAKIVKIASSAGASIDKPIRVSCICYVDVVDPHAQRNTRLPRDWKTSLSLNLPTGCHAQPWYSTEEKVL
jgi:hypothetical protein